MINNVQTQASNSGEKKTYEPLPDGNYTVAVDRVTEKECKNGRMIDISFKVSEGEFKNRLIWSSFLYIHKNPQAAGIGVQKLDKLLKSIGVHGGFESLGNDPSQLEQFVGREAVASTAIESNAGYKPRNIVKKFSRK